MTEDNNMIYLDGKIIDYNDRITLNNEKEDVVEQYEEEDLVEQHEDHDDEEKDVVEQDKPSNFISDIMKGLLLSFFFKLLAIYTNIELFIKDKFNLNKEAIKLEDIKLTKDKSDYDYYSNNKIIATSKTLTNRKNYDFALTNHYTNCNINYTEIILCHNKIKKRNIDICPKYFISIYFSIDENDYEIKLDNDNMNFYLTNNILDYTIINYIMLNNYNVNISNVPYNLIMIDDNSNVIELKETQYIRFYKNRYTIDNYD